MWNGYSSLNPSRKIFKSISYHLNSTSYVDDATLQNCVFFTENNSTELLFFHGTSQGFMIMRRIFFTNLPHMGASYLHYGDSCFFLPTMAASYSSAPWMLLNACLTGGKSLDYKLDVYTLLLCFWWLLHFTTFTCKLDNTVSLTCGLRRLMTAQCTYTKSLAYLSNTPSEKVTKFQG